MNYKLSLLSVAALPLLTACMFIGVATLPDPKPDRIAKVTTKDTLRAGVRYKYKILLTGKNYGFNPHGDPIGLLLVGRWHESPMEGAIFVNTLDGTHLPNDFRLSNYDVNPSGVIIIKDKTLTIDLKWTRVENGKQIENLYPFNGEYDLELLPDALNPPEIETQENKPKKERPIFLPVEGDTLGQIGFAQRCA